MAMLNGKTHSFDWAIFNKYVKLPEGSIETYWFWGSASWGKPKYSLVNDWKVFGSMVSYTNCQWNTDSTTEAKSFQAKSFPRQVNTFLNRIVTCRYRKWGTHVNNVGIAIINHPPNHHKWVEKHQKKWVVYDIAIPTLPNFKTGPCGICAGSIGVPLAPGQSRVMLWDRAGSQLNFREWFLQGFNVLTLPLCFIGNSNIKYSIPSDSSMTFQNIWIYEHN